MKLQGRTSLYDSFKEHKTEKTSPGLSTWGQMLQDIQIKFNSNDFLFYFAGPWKN